MLPDLWLSRPQGRRRGGASDIPARRCRSRWKPQSRACTLSASPGTHTLATSSPEPAPGPPTSPCSRWPSCRACPGGGGPFGGWAPGLGLLHMVGPAEIHGPEEALLL